MHTDSPTCSRQSMRLVFLTAASNKWEIKSLDIKAAFLQGDKMERDVFLRPPVNVCPENEVWKLKRCTYGLNDAPRAWYSRVNKEVLKRGATVSKYDSALLLWHKDGKLFGILAAYVDDFAYCGTYEWERTVVDSLKKTFKISTSARGTFRYVGLNVLQSKKGIKVDQNSYIAKIQPIYLESDRTKEIDSELSKDEVSKLRSISGQLLWATSQTRPDVAFEGCQVSNYGKHPTVRNILEANKAIRKLQSWQLSISFPDLGKAEDLRILCYSDATHASLPNGTSQGTYIVFLLGRNNMVAPITRQSKKISRVTKSPLASETLSLSEVADPGFMIASMVQEIHCLSSLPSVLCVYISQLIRYARCCSQNDDFRYRHKCLVDRLQSQGYKALRLEKSFKKFYGRYQDLIEKYQRSVNAMVSDSFPGQFLFNMSRNLVAFVIYMDLSLGFVYT